MPMLQVMAEPTPETACAANVHAREQVIDIEEPYEEPSPN